MCGKGCLSHLGVTRSFKSMKDPLFRCLLLRFTVAAALILPNFMMVSGAWIHHASSVEVHRIHVKRPGKCCERMDPSLLLSHAQPSIAASVWLARQGTESQSYTTPPGVDGGFAKDTVVRVWPDSHSVQLQRAGLVSLAAIRPVSSSVVPPCVSNTYDTKLTQLLPRNTLVRVQVIAMKEDGTGGSERRRPPQAVVVKVENGMVINTRLLSSGYARVRTKNVAPDLLPDATLQAALLEAREQNRGVYQTCSSSTTEGSTSSSTSSSNKSKNPTSTTTTPFVAEFEPIELTTEIRYGIDGGKQVLRRRDDGTTAVPKNPGDKVGCSDFETYEDALRYYERYFPYYGDVARLDRDQDGVPCPKLVHTTNPDKYRMKIPKAVISDGRQ